MLLPRFHRGTDAFLKTLALPFYVVPTFGGAVERAKRSGVHCRVGIALCAQSELENEQKVSRRCRSHFAQAGLKTAEAVTGPASLYTFGK